MAMEYIGLAVVILLVLLVVVVLAKSVALIPQAEAAVIERLGRYTRTVSGQLTLLLPFIDRIRARVDIRERVVSCLLYTSPSPRDGLLSRMPSSA